MTIKEIKQRHRALQEERASRTPLTEKQIRAALGRLQREAKSETDPAKLLADADLYPDWAPGRHYEKDDLVNYGGKLYRVVQAHDSQANWLPDAVLNLYMRVQVEVPNQILPWVAGEAVKAGDKRTYNGKMYECLQAHTTQSGWTPLAVPSLWKEVTG